MFDKKAYAIEYHKIWYAKNREKRIAQTSEYRRKNPEIVKAYRHKSARKEGLKRRHGVTLEWFNKKLEEQNNVCAICGNGFKSEKDKCVDHCHITEVRRSILCFNCNIGIGKFGDSVELLKKATEYLEKHNGL